jgi:hypothetical protein
MSIWRAGERSWTSLEAFFGEIESAVEEALA